MTSLRTARLELEPITLPLVEAVITGRRDEAERLVAAEVASTWPNRALVERAFSASLDQIRADPATRLWGDRIMIERNESGARRVVGSVVFHGYPLADGIAEVAYGVEEAAQGRGFATEATQACVNWALAQAGVVAVSATTFAWHTPSLRVMAKLGMVRVGTREHETLGELLVFETRRHSEYPESRGSQAGVR